MSIEPMSTEWIPEGGKPEGGKSSLIRCDRVTLYSGNPKLGHPLKPPKKGLKVALIQEVSWTVGAGELWWVVGASGAGKTSLLRLLNRLAEPTQGNLFWQEVPYAKIPVLQLRHQVTYVPQEPRLLGMTVEQALRYPLQLRNLPEPEIIHRVNDWCDRLLIPKQWRDRTELQLSLGERQWVAIARGMLIEPKVLLLDEPTANLDAQRIQFLQQVMTASTQTTWIVASHDLGWLQQISPQVLYLEMGKRVALTQPPNWEALQEKLQQVTIAEIEEWS
ncbi:MAG: ATP-binding cassette domain-containing protein [Synechococcales bacterium]|nr:ATP-binding cassette domain-containing protein [Synechococcales bacterium]